MRVADLTLEEFRSLIAQVVEEKLKDYIEEWQATFELMDKTLIKEYGDAKKEIENGKTVRWKDIKRNV